MGCIARLGCLFVLVIAAIVGWFTRDRWVPERFRARPPVGAATKAAAWEPLTEDGADRTRAALTKLSQPKGPVFQTLSGGDVASYIVRELAKRLPPSTDSIQAVVAGDRVSMRAVVNMNDIGGKGALGTIGSMLGDHERVEFTGTMHVVKPGLGEFQIQDVKVRGISLPHGMIATLIKRFGKGPHVEGVADDALPLPLPPYVGDIRVANGKVTLYKNVQ